MDLQGAYAEQAITAADRVVPLPDDISEETAAAVVLQGLTAHYLLFDSYRVRPHDVVLVHAAAGGMGLPITQIASKLGGTVIGTVSTVEKDGLARQAGAAKVIRYSEQDVTSAVRRITDTAGVAAVAMKHFEENLDDLERPMRAGSGSSRGQVIKMPGCRSRQPGSDLRLWVEPRGDDAFARTPARSA